MPKQRRNGVREPRKGAPVVTLLVVFILIAVVAAYFIFSPSSKTDIPEVKKSETPLNFTLPQPESHKKPSILHPDTAQKPAKVPRVHPKTRGVPSDAMPASNLMPGTGRLAIIVDDMGSSMSEARSLAAIGVTLNFSIIPGLRNYREVALFAESQGIETMVHIPMQSKGWPERRLETNGLLVSMGGAELEERVAGFLRDIPGVVGANNHMGSEFTEHEDKMRSVLGALKNKNVFFVDSVTSSRSAGLRLAREMGMKAGRRQVFLDNEQKRAYILGQLNQAVKIAKKTGSAIAICHPHRETIATLAAALPGLAGQGITLVHASELVR